MLPYANIVASNPLKRCLTVGDTAVCQSLVPFISYFTLTFIVEDLLLRRILVVDTAELESEVFAFILGIGNLY